MSNTKQQQEIAKTSSRHGFNRQSEMASEEELKERRHSKYLAGLQKKFGGRVKRFQTGGTTRNIL